MEEQLNEIIERRLAAIRPHNATKLQSTSGTENRFILRDLTRQSHNSLDAAVGGFSDRPTYERYLKAMASFRKTVETSLTGVNVPDEFDCWRPTLISPHLEQDLKDLGHSAPEATVAFSAPTDRESLFGILYVLEGSSLGARLLFRRASALGYTSDYGARHLAVQTATPESWKAFILLLNQSAWADPMKAVKAARLTFQVAVNAFTSGDRPQ